MGGGSWQYLNSGSSSSTTSARRTEETEESSDHGKCTNGLGRGMFSVFTPVGLVCSCNEGFTGPHCMSLDHVDESPSAYDANHKKSSFLAIHQFEVPLFMMATIVSMSTLLLAFLVKRTLEKGNTGKRKISTRNRSFATIKSGSNVSSIGASSIS
jgi:hypothetical protein